MSNNPWKIEQQKINPFINKDGGSSNSGGYYSPSLKASQQSNLVRDGRFVRNTIRSNKWGI